MKKVFVILTTAVAVALASAACDDDDGRQACEAFIGKCPAGTTTITCDANAINDAKNGGTVEDCIQGAADCAAAQTCYGTLER